MTREVVLGYFENYKGEILSGEDLARELGMTRAAIWKVIKSLREEGYDIEAIRKKGYRLNTNSDILSKIKIKSHLAQEFKESYIEVYKTIDSTNKRMSELILEGIESWALVASEAQTEGKTRDQMGFASPEGKGVYMSILVRPDKITWKDKEVYLEGIGEATANAIKKMTQMDARYYQPGDLCINGEKIGGIMTSWHIEGATERVDSIIIGIGIYVYEPSQNHKKQKALNSFTQTYYNRSELIAEIMNYLRDRFKA